MAAILSPLDLDFDIEHDGITVRGKWPDNEALTDGDRYSHIIENPFQKAFDAPLSTFSIDVDTASYAKVRRYILQENRLPPPDAVRIEELVNYFDYSDAPPSEDAAAGDAAAPGEAAPFAAHIELAACPWQPDHRLARIGIKGRVVPEDQRPAALTEAAAGDEWLTLSLKYKLPGGQTSQPAIVVVGSDEKHDVARASSDLRFAAAVAGFGLLLRDSAYRGNLEYDAVIELATGALGDDVSGRRAGFIELVREAKKLKNDR